MKNNCCRIATPDGGVLEIRTGGNILFDEDGPGLIIAQANYPLADFVENYDAYFCRPETRSDRAAAAK